jgi:hypothetical protein
VNVTTGVCGMHRTQLQCRVPCVFLRVFLVCSLYVECLNTVEVSCSFERSVSSSSFD